jgi:hypothetical protein
VRDRPGDTVATVRGKATDLYLAVSKRTGTERLAVEADETAAGLFPGGKLVP